MRQCHWGDKNSIVSFSALYASVNSTKGQNIEIDFLKKN